jgi:DNA-3-methyladenine glycosylase I
MPSERAMASRREGRPPGPVARRAAVLHADGRRRCAWCGTDPLYVRYHDEEWGVPVRDDRRLFEMLCLEGAQAGLSWQTILNKREHYRRAFDDFDPARIAAYTPQRIERLLADPGIVRNRLKVAAFIANARAFLELSTCDGAFTQHVWRFAPPRRRRRPTYLDELPATSPESDALSADLRRRGFKFVGPTICYAFMQAVGLVDDHQRRCWRAADRDAA